MANRAVLRTLTALAMIAMVGWGCGGGEDHKTVLDPGAGGDTSQCYHIGQEWPQSYPPMTEESAYQLALRWSQCVSIDGSNLPWHWVCGMGTCLSYELPEVDAPSMECILAAKDCDEVRCCWGVNSAESPVASEDVEFGKGRCEGSVRIEWWSLADGRHMARRWDCAWSSGNPKCLQDADGNIQCGSGTCTNTNEPPHCDGDVRVSCDKGIERRVDCAERGRKCALVATDEGQEAKCVVKEGCLVPYCDGNVFVLCQGGAEVGRYNCDWYGEGVKCSNPTRGEDGEWTGGCTAEGDKACAPDKDQDYCDGTKARYCLDSGVWAEFDCADFAGGVCRKYCPLDFGDDCEAGDDTCEPAPPCDPSDPTQGNSVGCAEGT